MTPNLGIYQWPGGPLSPNPTSGEDISGGSGPTQTAAPSSMTAPSAAAIAAAGNAPVPIYRPGMYGEGQLSPITFAGASDILVLPRPGKGIRAWLLIVNDLAASTIRVNFDSSASATIGIAIGPGGNLFMDVVVPQNDIHVFSPIAGLIHIAYINLDPTNPTRVIQANA